MQHSSFEKDKKRFDEWRQFLNEQKWRRPTKPKTRRGKTGRRGASKIEVQPKKPLTPAEIDTQTAAGVQAAGGTYVPRSEGPAALPAKTEIPPSTNIPQSTGTPRELQITSDVKDSLGQSYESGPDKDAWLSAGVSAEDYAIVQRWMRKVLNTPVHFDREAARAMQRQTGEPEHGIAQDQGVVGFYNPIAQGIFVQPSTGRGITNMRHEFGHRLDDAPPEIAELYAQARGIEAPSPQFQLPFSDIPAQGSSTAHPFSTMQASELNDLLDIEAVMQSFRQDRMGMIHIVPSNSTPGLKHGFDSLSSPRIAEPRSLDRLLRHRTLASEIYADVHAVRSDLGRAMTKEDIIDICAGVSSLGSIAIGKSKRFRDFLRCSDPARTAAAFNKIVQWAGAAGTAAAAGAATEDLDEHKKSKAPNTMKPAKSKLKQIINEELKLLLEQDPKKGPGPLGKGPSDRWRMSDFPSTAELRQAELRRRRRAKVTPDFGFQGGAKGEAGERAKDRAAIKSFQSFPSAQRKLARHHEKGTSPPLHLKKGYKPASTPAPMLPGYYVRDHRWVPEKKVLKPPPPWAHPQGPRELRRAFEEHPGWWLSGRDGSELPPVMLSNDPYGGYTRSARYRYRGPAVRSRSRRDRRDKREGRWGPIPAFINPEELRNWPAEHQKRDVGWMTRYHEKGVIAPKYIHVHHRDPEERSGYIPPVTTFKDVSPDPRRKYFQYGQYGGVLGALGLFRSKLHGMLPYVEDPPHGWFTRPKGYTQWIKDSKTGEYKRSEVVDVSRGNAPRYLKATKKGWAPPVPIPGVSRMPGGALAPVPAGQIDPEKELERRQKEKMYGLGFLDLPLVFDPKSTAELTGIHMPEGPVAEFGKGFKKYIAWDPRLPGARELEEKAENQAAHELYADTIKIPRESDVRWRLVDGDKKWHQKNWRAPKKGTTEAFFLISDRQRNSDEFKEKVAEILEKWTGGDKKGYYPNPGYDPARRTNVYTYKGKEYHAPTTPMSAWDLIYLDPRMWVPGLWQGLLAKQVLSLGPKAVKDYTTKRQLGLNRWQASRPSWLRGVKLPTQLPGAKMHADWKEALDVAKGDMSKFADWVAKEVSRLRTGRGPDPRPGLRQYRDRPIAIEEYAAAEAVEETMAKAARAVGLNQAYSLDALQQMYMGSVMKWKKKMRDPATRSRFEKMQRRSQALWTRHLKRPVSAAKKVVPAAAGAAKAADELRESKIDKIAKEELDKLLKGNKK